MYSRILVTGGAGFIGSWTVEKLVEKGYRVIVVDNFYSGDPGNLQSVIDKIVMVKADARDEEIMGRVMRQYSVDAVIHLAAIVGVEEVYINPKLGYSVNVGATFNLLEQARINDVQCFIYSSSAAVYGDPIKLPITEEHPLNPKNLYGATKLAAESLVIGYNRNYGLNTVSLRYFNVYGPRMKPGPYAGVILKFIENIKTGKPLVIYGSGKQTRDFIYVEDVALANLAVLEECRPGVYNVGTGESISIKALAELMLELSGSDVGIVYRSPRPGDIMYSEADITRIRKEIGWEPRIDLYEGLRKTIDYYLGTISS